MHCRVISPLFSLLANNLCISACLSSIILRVKYNFCYMFHHYNPVVVGRVMWTFSVCNISTLARKVLKLLPRNREKKRGDFDFGIHNGLIPFPFKFLCVYAFFCISAKEDV